MKRIILLIFMIFVNILCSYSQQIKKKIGDNPTVMSSSSVLEVESTNKGVLLPRVALTSNQDITTIPSPQISLLVYNTATAGVYPNNVVSGFYYWDGVIWTKFSSTVNGTIISMNCESATHKGVLSSNSEAIGVFSEISYSGGNGGVYTSQSIASTGVFGLTATLLEGTLASGAGSLVFAITGTPTSSGNASFEINIGGQTCTLDRIVVF